MKQIKLFSGNSAKEVETKVNEWLQEHDWRSPLSENLKFAASTDSFDILIIYTTI